MVFIVIQIRSQSKILKPWLGIKVSDNMTLQQLYNDFGAGQLDTSAQLPNEYNTVQVWPSIGRTKNDMIPIDITATVGEATSVLGNFVEFRVETLDEPSGSQSNVNLRPSAFDILLQASKSKCNLPDKVVENNKKDKLKNDLIDWLKGNGVGWSEGERISANTALI